MSKTQISTVLNSQDTNKKNRRHPDLFSQRHLQIPYDMLRQNQDRKIGSSVDDACGYVDYVKVETTAFDPWIPIFSNRCAGECPGKNTNNVKNEIQP